MAAGIVVGKLGTATVSTDELREPCGHTRGGAQGCWRRLVATALAQARSRRAGSGDVRPFEPFDVRRLGEIEAASRLGDRLLLIDLADDGDDDALRLHAALRAVDWWCGCPAQKPKRCSAGTPRPRRPQRPRKRIPKLPAVRVCPVGIAQDPR